MSDPKVSLSFLCPRDRYDRFKELVEGKGYTLSSQMRALLIEYVEKEEKRQRQESRRAA